MKMLPPQLRYVRIDWEQTFRCFKGMPAMPEMQRQTVMVVVDGKVNRNL